MTRFVRMRTCLADAVASRMAGIQRLGALSLLATASLLAGSASMPASAAAANRIDLKVLLLSTSSTSSDYADFQSWEAALQREGIPFDTVNPTTTAITSATLTGTTLADGTLVGKYEGIIVPTGGMVDCSTSCTTELTAPDATALEQYEQTFNVRQIDGDAYPGSSTPATAYGYGLNGVAAGGVLDGTSGSLTADGQKVFSYLKSTAPITMDTGTFGEEATPAAGANFDTLVSGPGNSSLVGILTDPNDVQQLVETFDHNQYQLQSELLRHGELAWLTRGVYFGDQRNYLETNIDDNFLSDDSWDTTTHSTDYTPANALRETAPDVIYAAKWSDANGFRIDDLFNGGGSVAWAADCTLAAGASGGGATTGCGTGSASNTDPLLAQFQTTCTSNCGPGNAGAGKSYANSFGWINHTWDHPNLDQGCATQNYIEAEIQNNTNWANTAPGSTLGSPTATSGGLGLTEDPTGTIALGAENPTVVVTGEHSGLANLLPGNPGIVDPPAWDDATYSATGGTLAAGTYTYAITDSFTVGGPQSSASETEQVLTAPGSVSLTWQAVCHAAEYHIYRADGPTTAPTNWVLLATVGAPSTAPPNTSFGDPTSPTIVGSGGALEQTFTDTGAAGTAATAPSTTANAAVESAYEQNTNLPAAFTAIGLKAFGSDSSKPYPSPATATFNTGTPPTTQFAAGSTFADGSAQAEARYPTNIYYNVSTEQQEVDEYNYLYAPPPAGDCTNSATTTCLTTPATFSQIIASVDQGMFQHVMGNDPRPDYFHQTNMMGQPPAGSETGTGLLPSASYVPPATAPATGDGLYYSTMDPLLYEYSQYFSTPLQQPTTLQVANLLAEQANWATLIAAATPAVSGYIQGNQVTITNSGAAVATPLTGIASVGSAYGGTQSGWTNLAAGTTTLTSPTTWPQQAPQGTWVTKVGKDGYLLAGWNGTQDASAFTPNVTATLVQGSRTQWAVGSADVRALQAPDGSTNRNAAGFTDPSAVKVTLKFAGAYNGPISLYAVDWNNAGLKETLSVNDGTTTSTDSPIEAFSQGDWWTPQTNINVPAGGTVTITATGAGTGTSAGAVLSGVFLGGAGTPPAPATPTTPASPAATVLSLGAPIATCTQPHTCTYAAAHAPLTTPGGKKPQGVLYLETRTGTAISGAQLKIVDGTRTTMVQTGARGTASFTLPVGPSRQVTVSYAGTSTHASATVTFSVQDVAYGTIRLLRTTATGAAVFAGNVIGANGKPAKLVVKLQYSSSGHWRTVKTVHPTATGKWQATVARSRKGHAASVTKAYYRVQVAGTPSAQISARLG